MARERPILFSAPMVRALLEGRKHQTRRAVRDQSAISDVAGGGAEPVLWWPREGDEWLPCPYGVPGDRLYVKEAIRRTDYGAEFIADGAPTKADCWPWKNKALPSIHMPKGLRRITLEVTDVRVQRLQDISEEDARAEGVEPGCDPEDARHEGDGGSDVGAGHGYSSPRSHVQGFANLWGDINGPESWDANPWVWVISFKRTTPGETPRG